MGIDSRVRFDGIDSNDWLHYPVVGWNVEMAVYNYAPYPVWMKIGSGKFEPYVNSSTPVTPAK